ncbi:MAG TPA: TolC family protein, partial [Gemmatimonadales bacterium]|nr:TolC family protein [Gemmatimonadales bacterium]
MPFARSLAALVCYPVLALGQEPATAFPAPVAAPAPRQPAVNLSLADAIALAKQNNPAYRQFVNSRRPAAWGVRNAYANFLPSFNMSGGIGYTGAGQQLFLSQAFTQNVATWSSNYNLQLDWQLSGFTLSQPGLRRAQLAAADADITGAETNLVSLVTQQYITVLEALANSRVSVARRDRDNEFLKLAQARYDVGRATLIDVRQAEVARGQAEVAVLQARTAIQVEKLRLFQDLGTAAPAEVDAVQLTDTFPVTTPPWQLEELLTLAEAQNPALAALRARENAANWNVRSTNASYGPSFS